MTLSNVDLFNASQTMNYDKKGLQSNKNKRNLLILTNKPLFFLQQNINYLVAFLLGFGGFIITAFWILFWIHM